MYAYTKNIKGVNSTVSLTCADVHISLNVKL